MEIGTQVSVEITDPGLDKPITVKAQVARVEKFDSHYDIGVSFLEINDTDGSEIAQALANSLGIPINQITNKY